MEGLRQILVVANQTLGGPDLVSVLQERLEAAGPAEIYVLVPATEAPGSTDFALLGPGGSAPTTIAGGGAAGAASAEATHSEDAYSIAERRLQQGLAKLAELGTTVDGEVGHHDPMHAIEQVVQKRTVDEIVISTLPSGVSRWLRTDLPHRVQRKFDQPLTVITAG